MSRVLFQIEDFRNKPDHIRRQVLGESTGPAPSKMKNKRASASPDLFPELAGLTFQSKLERDRAKELVLMGRAGMIKDLEFQPKIVLEFENEKRTHTVEIKYKADFRYLERVESRHEGEVYFWRTVIEDTKGHEGDRWKMIKALWPIAGPEMLRVTMAGQGNAITIVKEIFPA